MRLSHFSGGGIRIANHVWVGDFNRELGRDLGGQVVGAWAKKTSGKGAETLLGYFDSKNLREATNHNATWAKEVTWRPLGKQPGKPSRIDHIFIHKSHTPNSAKSSKIEWWEDQGDHAAIIFEWCFGGTIGKSNHKGGGMWQCSNCKWWSRCWRNRLARQRGSTPSHEAW